MLGLDSLRRIVNAYLLESLYEPNASSLPYTIPLGTAISRRILRLCLHLRISPMTAP